MQLRYISISALIAEAGGDPWAVDRSLQAGSPFRISSSRRPFMLPGGVPPRRTTRLSKPATALTLLGIIKTETTRSTTRLKCSG